ncbi:aminomethyl-transferring glycine dehydrogenase subunit GcvPA [Aeropyrum camini]|uniref:Probable glycine dehydrogenase (decarboxylating) subunit 1 n=2 Tax=Aeropyrum camini TaxID=229980 RepID=U3TB78_9CREN|nr:aminomethyl-transferring glycine dehydrogenase subunit GcvPA [Aeropyrum camini]BAN90797.1 glycine dehydrogenase subunit 1 [Aeropyrum camini SY1 = JCM 12091]
MEHPWIPNSHRAVLDEMLEAMGVSSVDDLYRDIPPSIKLSPEEWDSLPIGEGRPLREAEVLARIERLLSRNRYFTDPPPFMGGGVWPRYIPSAVKALISRGEFLTAYTPYQAEISQGLMQALFEYQSLVAELLEMEVVNASLYDWSSAVGEAILMARRVTRRERVLVPETMNPLHLETAASYAYGGGVKIEEVRVDRETGFIDLEDLERKLSHGDTAALYMEYPSSYTGVIDENIEAAGEAVHRAGGLFILGVEPVSMALLKPPGRLGADVAVGDGQPLGLGLNYGGPYLGVFAVRWEGRLVRQMPGRLIGMTVDAEGRRAFAMILQTREQHIRRAKATSNITTNEALMAIAAAVYLSLLGPQGLREVAEASWYMSHYAARKLSELEGVSAPLLRGEFIMDFTVRLPIDAAEARRRLLEKGVLAGIPLGGFSFFTRNDMLLTVTEAHSKRHVDLLVDLLDSVLGG